MARVLLANELGMGDVHLRRLCALAQALRAHGHEPVPAVHDLPKAHTLLADGTLRRVLAPAAPRGGGAAAGTHLHRPHAAPRLCQPAVAAEPGACLARPGHAAAAGAGGGRPLAALFATRELGLPRLRFGDGIGCPPLATPMPPMTWWDEAQRSL